MQAGDATTNARTTRTWLVPVLAGVILGLAASATDFWGGASRTLAIAGQLAGPWLLVAGAVGRARRDLREAAIVGLVTLLVGVVIYDSIIILTGGSPLFAALWLVMAVVVGPVGGMLGRLADDEGNAGIAAHAILWGTAVGEAAARIDPLNNQLAWVTGGLISAAIATARRGRRVAAAVGIAIVAALAAVAFPLLLSGIAGW